MKASMFKHFSLSFALTLIVLAPAQAGEIKTVILLEIGGGTPIHCLRSPDEKSMQQCMALSEHKSRTLTQTACYRKARRRSICWRATWRI